MNKKIIYIFALIILIIFSTIPSARASLSWESDIGIKISNFIDDDSREISLGFNVNFYGISYSTVYVNSNGSVTFGDRNYDPTNLSFPVSEYIDSFGDDLIGDERTMIAPLWDDLSPDPNDTGRSTSGVYTNIIGAPGSRKFVITWNDVSNYNRLTGGYYGSNTFQLILYEWTNDIQFNYHALDGIKDPQHTGTGTIPRDLNGITIGVNAGDLPTDSIIRGTQYLYGFSPYSPPLPENDSLLFTYDPNYYGAGLGEYTASILSTPASCYGDVSGNGTITSFDAALIAQYSVDLISEFPICIGDPAKCLEIGDVSGNGTITSFDAALIAQYSVDLISEFPVGTPVCTP